MNMNERTTGTHAPSRNLIREAEKYKASIAPKNKTKQIARRTLRCQHRTITRDIKQVVTSITVITARPEWIKTMNSMVNCKFQMFDLVQY